MIGMKTMRCWTSGIDVRSVPTPVAHQMHWKTDTHHCVCLLPQHRLVVLESFYADRDWELTEYFQSKRKWGVFSYGTAPHSYEKRSHLRDN